MAVKRRLDKKRAALEPNQEAWLRGDRDCGFIQYKSDDELQRLWYEHSDHETMYWDLSEFLPVPIR